MPEFPSRTDAPNPRDPDPTLGPRACADPSSVHVTLRLSGTPAVPQPPDTQQQVKSSDDTPLAPTGEAPGGRYHLIRELARGGMGAVYRGFDCELRRETAVKVLLEKHLD